MPLFASPMTFKYFKCNTYNFVAHLCTCLPFLLYWLVVDCW